MLHLATCVFFFNKKKLLYLLQMLSAILQSLATEKFRRLMQDEFIFTSFKIFAYKADILA